MTEMYHNFGNATCDPLKYTMDNLVLFQPRKTRSDITEILLTGTYSIQSNTIDSPMYQYVLFGKSIRMQRFNDSPLHCSILNSIALGLV